MPEVIGQIPTPKGAGLSLTDNRSLSRRPQWKQ